MNKAAEILQRFPKKESTINLLARNWFQVKNSDTIIAIAPIDDSLKFVEGGTGWAVAMAQANANTRPRNINVFNTKDNTWYIWNEKPSVMSFVKTVAPTLTKDFAGIGSRQDGGTGVAKMTPESIQAIRDVYEKTFGKPGFTVEISANSTGLAAALTNPTELAKKRGNLTESYPINYNGKTYVDVEAAYQELKNKSEAQTKPAKEDSGNYKLMVKLLEAKLTQHPRLVRAIINEGGTEFLFNATHQPTYSNTVWETGGQNWFISALIDAYGNLDGNADTPGGNRSLFGIEPALENFYRSLTKEQLNNPNLPSMDDAQFMYDQQWEGSIESFIEELRCKL